ncbi:MAG: polysaccharide pyruvyl transferase family protein [Bilifractor sp.]
MLEESNGKKVLQVTLYDNRNIGNRLQCYALYQLLVDRHCEVTLLRDRREYQPGRKVVLKNRIKHLLGILGSKEYKTKYKLWTGDLSRNAAMQQFSDKYLGKVIDASDGVDHIDFSKYELGIVGSDQVWHHWNDDDGELPYFYLEFLPVEKRTAYAASFGFDDFRRDDILQHKKGLQGMHYISCREARGCELVRELTGKDVPHVLDPTLIFDALKWKLLEKDANSFAKSQQDYVFIYFLGNITEEYHAEIVKKAAGKQIINFGNLEDADIAACGPIEFLYLIDHADYVITDSFHCTVFSILFNKPFTVVRRQQEGFDNMFGRIEELLISTGNEDKALGGVDRSIVEESFENMKTRSLKYLDEILQ